MNMTLYFMFIYIGDERVKSLAIPTWFDEPDHFCEGATLYMALPESARYHNGVIRT